MVIERPSFSRQCARVCVSLADPGHHLNQRISDGHARKALGASVGARGGMTAQTADQRQVEVKLFHEPVHVRAGVAAQNLSNDYALFSPEEDE